MYIFFYLFFFSLIVLFYYIEKMLIQYRYGLGGLLTQDQTSDIGDRTQCHSAGIGPPWADTLSCPNHIYAAYKTTTFFRN